MGPIGEAGASQRVLGSMPPPDGIAAIQPAVLHIGHSWGGGVARWIADFAGADTARRHFLLRLEPRRDALGARIELFDLAQAGEAVATWTLHPAIGATALHHQPYREILQLVIHDLGIDELIISSLVGHALDVLDTGLPTTVVMHDLYPFCPAMFGWFGKACQVCDLGELARCRDENPYNVLWSRCVPRDWVEFRKEYARLLSAAHVRLVAPSRSVAERYATLFPVLREKTWELIPHGVDAAALSIEADATRLRASSERLRIVIPGRLSPQKGLAVLRAIIERLAAFADVLLLGAGECGAPFAELTGVEVVTDYAYGELAARISEFQPDCALLLSVLPESFSYTLSEMWALGIPPVATNLGAFAERIHDGQTGFLVEPDAEAVLARLRTLKAQREQLSAIALRLRALPVRTVAEMVADYRAAWPMQAASKIGGMATAAICESLHRARRHGHWLETVRIVALRHELAESRNETWAYQTEVDIQRREVLRRDADIAALQRERDADIAALQRELDAERARREEILASHSWRLTQPLRRLVSAVRRDSQGLTPDPVSDAVPDEVQSPMAPPDPEVMVEAPDSLRVVLAPGDPLAVRRCSALSSTFGVELMPFEGEGDSGAAACTRSDVICLASGAQPSIALVATESAARIMESHQVETRRVQFPLIGDWPQDLLPREAVRTRQRERLAVPDASRLVVGIGSHEAASGLVDFVDAAAALMARRNGYVFVWLGAANPDGIRRHRIVAGTLLATPGLFLLDETDFESWLLAADSYLGCRKRGEYDAGALEALAAGVPVVVADEGSLPDAIRARSEWLKMVAVGDPGRSVCELLLRSERTAANDTLAAEIRQSLGSESVRAAMVAEMKAALCHRGGVCAGNPD